LLVDVVEQLVLEESPGIVGLRLHQVLRRAEIDTHRLQQSRDERGPAPVHPEHGDHFRFGHRSFPRALENGETRSAMRRAFIVSGYRAVSRYRAGTTTREPHCSSVRAAFTE